MWESESTAPKYRGLWWTVFGLFRDGADNVVYDAERQGAIKITRPIERENASVRLRQIEVHVWI